MKKNFQNILCIIGASVISVTAMSQKTFTGFTESGSAKQKQNEQKFDAVLSAEKIGATIKDLSSKPHHLGSV